MSSSLPWWSLPMIDLPPSSYSIPFHDDRIPMTVGGCKCSPHWHWQYPTQLLLLEQPQVIITVFFNNNNKVTITTIMMISNVNARLPDTDNTQRSSWSSRNSSHHLCSHHIQLCQKHNFQRIENLPGQWAESSCTYMLNGCPCLGLSVSLFLFLLFCKMTLVST